LREGPEGAPAGAPFVHWGMVAVGAVCAAAFGLLTWSVVAGGGVVTFDDDVEHVVVGHRVGWVTWALKVLTWLGSSVVLWPLVVVVGIVLVVSAQRWREALFLVLALGGSVVLPDLVKALVDRPRPSRAIRLVHVSGSSYPSGHAMYALAAFVAIALVAGAGRRPARVRWALGVAAGVVIAVVGWSRVYLGTHWLTDVLGAYLLGGAWVAALASVLLTPRGGPARTEPYPPGPGP
jgi:undecaprenyl-diphosphatase